MGKKDSVGLYVLGLLASIVVAVGFIMFGIPLLLTAFDEPWKGWILVIFIVPVVPVITEILQQEKKYSILGFFRAYMGHTLQLVFQLLFLVIIFPLIAFQLAAVIMYIMLFALTIMLGGHTLAYFTGWPDHMLMQGKEFWIILGCWVGGIVLGVLNVYIIKAAEKREEKFWDIITGGFEKIQQFFKF